MDRQAADDGRSAQLPPDCQVIDLTGELPETTPLRRRYAYLPMLDLQAPTPSQLRRVLDEIALHRRADTPVYVHCAMGYSRSRWIARLYLRKQYRCPSPSIS